MGAVRAGAGYKPSAASGAQVVEGGLQFNGDDQYLTKTFGSAGNRRTFTFSFWAKRTEYGATNMGIFSEYPGSGNGEFVRFSDDDGGNTFRFYSSELSAQSLVTKRKFRDTRWYHICVAVDTTQTTDTDRVKIYINGERNIDWASATWPSQDAQYDWLNSTDHYIGRCQSGSYFPGSLSQFYVIDGKQLDPFYFGYTDPLTNTWRPKKLSKRSGPNDGTVWSAVSYNSVTGTTGDTDMSNAFDGDLTTYTSLGSGDGSCTATVVFTPPYGFQNVNGVRVYIQVDRGQSISVNGTQTNASVSAGWNDTGFRGNVGSITIGPTSSGSSSNINAIEVDGVILVDGTTINGETDLDYGTNGFYLPMDGSAPIGRDQSGKGNDWLPVNISNSTNAVNPTGALPIFNTVSGGNVASAGVRTDASGNSCVLALPLFNSSVDVSNQINSGSTTKVMTVNGNTTASSAESNLYGGSYYFDGTGDWLVNNSSSSDFSFGTGDFTIECWAYWTGSGEEGLFQLSTNANGYNAANTNTVSLRVDSGAWVSYANDGNRTWSSKAVTNRWYHLAIVRDSGTLRLYVNGNQDPTTFADTRDYSMTYCGISGNYSATYLWTGYIQDFRVYKGSAKYTGDFIPTSTNPDILPDTPSGVALGSPLTKVTEGCVAFDGSGDYLSLPDSADWNLGSGDFTIEAFIYGNSFGSYEGIIAQWPESGAHANNSWVLEPVSGDLEFYYCHSGATLVGPIQGGTLIPKKWQHVAAVRSSNTMYIFIDGVMYGSGTSVTETFNDSSADLTIGGNVAGGGMLDGFISNARVVKGTALYTANFTPPTAPLTAVTNTKLLCCQDTNDASAAAVAPDAGTGTALLNMPLSGTPFTDSSSTGATITNTGSITAETDLFVANGANRFNITNAADLDGSSQRLSTNNTNLPFDDVVWTFDIWFSLDYDAANFNLLLNTGYGASSSPYMYIGINDDEKPYLETSDSGTRTIATNALVRNKWYHMRVRSDGTNMRMYIDGVLVVTKTCATTDMSSAGTKTIGSALDNGNNTGNFDGLIGPVRYVSSDLGPPPVGGLKTSSGALSNTPDLPDIMVHGNAAAINFNPFNTNINTVIGKESGYPTLNPLANNGGVVISEGNLQVDEGSSGEYHNITSTFGMRSGKFYCEYQHTYSSTGNGLIGISPGSFMQGAYAGSSMGSDSNTTNAYGFYTYNRGVLHENSYNINGVTSNYHSRVPQYSTIGIALDMDNYKCWWSVDGVWQNYANCGLTDPDPVTGRDAPASGLDSYGDTWYFCWTKAGAETGIFNFGQKPFKYTPPEGFGPANIANLPSPEIVTPNRYVGVTTYAGNGTAVAVSGYEFAPDFIWLKGYTDADRHGVYDTVRGVRERLQASENVAEDTVNGVMSFDPNGFSVGDYADTNGSGRGYVGWCWKAGGNKNTFNVDDIGYASASDVNMDVGGLNSSVYLMDEVYSDVLYGYNQTHGAQFQSGAEAVKAFNGTIGSAWNEGASPLGAGPTTFIRFTPSSQVATNTVSVYINYQMDVNFFTGTPGSCEHVAGPFNTDVSAYFTKVDCGTVPAWDFMEMRSTNGTGGVYFGGIEIGGKLLIDSDVTPPTSVPTIAATGASVGTKGGFSITVQTAASGSGDTMQVAHGLTQKPDFIIGKDLDNGSTNWAVYHSSLGATKKADLDTTGAPAANANYWANTEPTSSVIYTNAASWMYTSASFVLYSWHDIPGLQKFGSYEGNNDSDNAYVELGFEPAIIIFKNADNTANWMIYDNVRDKFNVTYKCLYPNLQNDENTTITDNEIDICSTGFKVRNDDGQSGDADTYIYAAWAYQPMNNLYGAQSNAR